MSEPAIIVDSITQIDAEARDKVVICGSHAGSYVAGMALSLGLRAVLLNDAGIGRERAGVAGLDILESYAMPAAALSHRSARIGDGIDCARRGRVSVVNRVAADLGVRVGQEAKEAAFELARGRLRRPAKLNVSEARRLLDVVASVRIVALDSAGLLEKGDIGAIVATGSHGALLGGRPATAVKVPVKAALFNDADGGIDDAGYSRLPALDARGIPAATVSVWTARIGNGASTLRDGIITRANRTATVLGCKVGSRACEFVSCVLSEAWEMPQ